MSKEISYTVFAFFEFSREWAICQDGAVTAGGLVEEEWVDLELWLEINRSKRFQEWLKSFRKDPELHPIVDYPAGAVRKP